MEKDQFNNQEKEGQKKSKSFYFGLLGLVIAVLVVVFGFIRGKETGAPTIVSSPEKDSAASVEDKSWYNPDQYRWSTMNEGPYNDSISYATSTDLLNWIDSGVTLATHASVPDAIVKDGIIYIYFVDVSTDGEPEKIGMIKSSDQGKTWSDKQIVNIEGLGRKVAVDPDPYLLSNGKIRLYYFDIAITKQKLPKGFTNKIYSAISSDGINFTEEEGIRFEYEGIFDPDVIENNDGTWRMYVGNFDGQKVYSASSVDGISFEYEGVVFSGGAIPNVFYENGTYYLFTGGIDISNSSDGKTFKRTQNRFDTGKITADPGVVKLGENNYFMVYKTKPFIK